MTPTAWLILILVAVCVLEGLALWLVARRGKGKAADLAVALADAEQSRLEAKQEREARRQAEVQAAELLSQRDDARYQLAHCQGLRHYQEVPDAQVLAEGDAAADRLLGNAGAGGPAVPAGPPGRG